MEIISFRIVSVESRPGTLRARCKCDSGSTVSDWIDQVRPCRLLLLWPRANRPLLRCLAKQSASVTVQGPSQTGWWETGELSAPTAGGSVQGILWQCDAKRPSADAIRQIRYRTGSSRTMMNGCAPTVTGSDKSECRTTASCTTPKAGGLWRGLSGVLRAVQRNSIEYMKFPAD